MLKYPAMLLNHILKKPSLYFFVVLLIFSVDRHKRYEGHKDDLGSFYSDVEQYYRFLPDLFITGYEGSKTAIEQNKRTIGMAVFYAPGFFVGHLKAKIEGAPQTGYSLPYQWAVRWGSILYVIIGLFFCRLNLLMFFSEWVTCICLACLLFATNLFYYTYSWGEYAHGYLFCFYAIFIHCVLRVLKHQQYRYLMWAGLSLGIITWIRPTGILMILFPLLYNVYSWRNLQQRVALLVIGNRYFLPAIVLFCLPLLTQLIFWKIFVNKFIHYSYVNERFYFDDPQVFNFLFSYIKGWFVYTPLMVFAMIGLAPVYKNQKELFLPTLSIVVLAVYVLSSWWDWTYGGSFGCRAMVEFYALLAFPLASFISWVWDLKRSLAILNGALRVLMILVFYLLVELNFLQSMQIRNSIMHWDGVSRESYWLMFGKSEFSKEDLELIRSKNKLPDPEKMRRGDRDHN